MPIFMRFKKKKLLKLKEANHEDNKKIFKRFFEKHSEFR